MHLTTTTEQCPQAAGIRGPQVPGKGSLGDQSSLGDRARRPSAKALQAEPCLHPPCPDAGRDRPPAHSQCRAAFEFGGRAGFQARHLKDARSAFLCAVSVAASIRLSEAQNTQPILSRTSNLRPATSSFYSTQWTSRTHIKCRAISNLSFPTRQFSRSPHLPVSAAESAWGTDASHTLPVQIRVSKGLR